MIKRFNDYESINEKWGLEFIIPILIAFGVATESEAQTMSRKKIENIIETNPDIKIALENKKILNDTLSKLEDLDKSLRFLDDNNISDIEEVKLNLEKSDLSPQIKDIIKDKLDGSYLINIPKIGTIISAELKIWDGFKVKYSFDIDSHNIGVKKYF